MEISTHCLYITQIVCYAQNLTPKKRKHTLMENQEFTFTPDEFLSVWTSNYY